MQPSLFPGGPEGSPVAILALADGTIFRGISIGADGHTVAEVLFNTSMTGHQEILTDPSYHSQIVTFTYPHIGSTGINTEDNESSGIQVAGLVIRDCPKQVSNFRAHQSLPDYLKQNGVVAISGVDTRKLTRILREGGVQGACILVGDDAERALELARGFQGIENQQLVTQVSTESSHEWDQGTWQLGQGYTDVADARRHVVAYDFGLKQNILRMLADRQCRITVVPATTPASEVLALKPDGVFLSNGPGDPSACDFAIDATRQLLDAKIPVFVICLGLQLIALSLGATVSKMKTGHHGANHPVKDLATGRVYITSQNHDFNVETDSLPDSARITHTSLFDGSLQGFELTDRPAFCFQGHPEASPGPHDMAVLFDKFINLMAGQH